MSDTGAGRSRDRDTDPDGSPSTAREAREPTVYDHYGVDDATGESDDAPDPPVDPGVYRVVGLPEGSVTLLRVGDADGRRVHTGAVATLDREALAALDPADNPDGTRSTGATVASALDGLAWQVRTFLGNLAARPFTSLAAVALLVVGHQGERFLAGPELAFTVVYLAGVLALVYLGARGG